MHSDPVRRDARVTGEPARKEIAAAWFAELRDQLCAAFEAIEVAAGGEAPAGRFERTPWQRPGGGGGVMAVLRGRVFEKAGVNVSTVHGELAPEFRREIPGAKDDPRFWASGVSVVIHPCSPHVPAAHMNTRYIVTAEAWFGGGADLTPVIPDETDTASFHAALEAACDAYESGAYVRFKESCDEYFTLAHRGEPRGVGGIFYDRLRGDHWERDLDFTKAVGQAFLEAYPAIVRRHMDAPWTEAEREAQLVRRGRYVEFNLLYDRGTRFGLETGGNVEAILMSLPPVVKWP